MRGFLLGKFLPPHLGHVYLCDFARHCCDELTILVCTLEREPIEGALRLAWMEELFPRCRVRWLNEDVPQEPAEHPDFWPIWRELVARFHPEPLDLVFASEPYGHRLAAEVGARFVPVDPLREVVPASGSAIRRDPFANWRWIPPPVRPHFAKTVCLFGPESTGKSTLACRLARRFETTVQPEYARVYTEAFGTEVTAEDLHRIAAGHRAATGALLRQANRILIMDTDPLLTAVWSRMLLGRAEPGLALEEEAADFYLLTDVDFPWQDDGTRYFPDPRDRQRFFALCRAELERRGLPFVVLSGSERERLETAVATIEARWTGLRSRPARPEGSPRPRSR